MACASSEDPKAFHTAFIHSSIHVYIHRLRMASFIVATAALGADRGEATKHWQPPVRKVDQGFCSRTQRPRRISGVSNRQPIWLKYKVLPPVAPRLDFSDYTDFWLDAVSVVKLYYCMTLML